MILTTTSALALFLTMLVLSAVPGPSDFAVVARSLASGFGQGLVMVLGIVAADLVFILLAVYSLSVIADSFDGLFRFVRYACGAYLLWLAQGMWRAVPAADGLPEPGSSRGSFMTGFMITLADPKAILFYMGLLPAFVELTAVTLADTLAIMLIATVVICLVKLAYAWMADRARRLFTNPRARRRLNRLAALVLGGLGLFLFVGT